MEASCLNIDDQWWLVNLVLWSCADKRKRNIFLCSYNYNCAYTSYIHIIKMVWRDGNTSITAWELHSGGFFNRNIAGIRIVILLETAEVTATSNNLWKVVHGLPKYKLRNIFWDRNFSTEVFLTFSLAVLVRLISATYLLFLF